INSTNKTVARACVERNAELIGEIALQQMLAGAQVIDVNAGALPTGEVEALEWLVTTVQAAVDLPVMIDTTDAVALRAALEVHGGKPIVNSISGESNRLKSMLPLLRDREVGVVALCVDDRGISREAKGKLDIATRLVETLLEQGVPLEDIYVDPLLQPVSLSSETVPQTLEVVSEVVARFPGVHAICGLSNVSFGLPERGLMHMSLIPMLMAAGMDAAILDVLDARLMAVVKTSDSLLGHDPYCEAYLSAHRMGILSQR
ncbi:MAG: dihydropteroate synthase, partial [Dehalococcoidales bacterium]|nr:dihydropteroate synthase [Dehalococcoidales bacterium]